MKQKTPPPFLFLKKDYLLKYIRMNQLEELYFERFTRKFFPSNLKLSLLLQQKMVGNNVYYKYHFKNSTSYVGFVVCFFFYFWIKAW